MPLGALGRLAEEIRAGGVRAHSLDQLGVLVEPARQDAVHHLKRPLGPVLGAAAVGVQRLDVLALAALRQAADKPVAGEDGRHLGDQFGVAGEQG